MNWKDRVSQLLFKMETDGDIGDTLIAVKKKEKHMTKSQLERALSLASNELASYLHCPKNFKKPEEEKCFGGCTICIEKDLMERSIIIEG